MVPRDSRPSDHELPYNAAWRGHIRSVMLICPFVTDNRDSSHQCSSQKSLISSRIVEKHHVERKMLYHRHSLALSASVDRQSTAFITPRFSTPSSRVHERQQRKHTWLFVTFLQATDMFRFLLVFGIIWDIS